MSAPHPKQAITEYDVLPLVANRWSPCVFDPRPVEREKLLTCLEAASWAASSYNEQPWRFIVAERSDEVAFARLLDCLIEANQTWARDAGVLLLTVVSRSFARNGTPNRMAEHDLGLAVGNFSIQATALGLYLHQMAGFNPAKARAECGIPEGYDPITAIALGYLGDPAKADSQRAARDQSGRSRKSLPEITFNGRWDRPIE